MPINKKPKMAPMEILIQKITSHTGKFNPFSAHPLKKRQWAPNPLPFHSRRVCLPGSRHFRARFSWSQQPLGWGPGLPARKVFTSPCTPTGRHWAQAS